MEKLYGNIGAKIKMLAKISCVVMAVGSFLGGLIMVCLEDALWSIGFPMMFGGPIMAWIGSWILYAFGEITEKISLIERNTRGGKTISQTQAIVDEKRMAKLEELRSSGLITEEEYRAAVEKGKDA